ncbi:MAG: HAD family phosphatase [Polyangiaceae bacterium]|nr:HAD family phosphatase [Polyangiaceae bacterium]
MRHRSGLVFDMDGLLVDSEPVWFAAERDFAASLGGRFDEADGRACVGQGVRATARYIRERWAPGLDEVAAAASIVAAFVRRVGELEPKRGARAILEAAAARALPLALASSSSEALIAAVLERCGLAPFFAAVVSGESVARHKPAPDVFLEAARRLGLPPAELCAFEDSLPGATAARAAGMYVVAVPERASERARFVPVADLVVADLDEARVRLDL